MITQATSNVLARPRAASSAPVMTIPRWTPRTAVTKQEAFVLGRLHRTRKLFGFLARFRAPLRP